MSDFITLADLLNCHSREGVIVPFSEALFDEKYVNPSDLGQVLPVDARINVYCAPDHFFRRHGGMISLVKTGYQVRHWHHLQSKLDSQLDDLGEVKFAKGEDGISVIIGKLPRFWHEQNQKEYSKGMFIYAESPGLRPSLVVPVDGSRWIYLDHPIMVGAFETEEGPSLKVIVPKRITYEKIILVSDNIKL